MPIGFFQYLIGHHLIGFLTFFQRIAKFSGTRQNILGKQDSAADCHTKKKSSKT
ncbi:hypothetical protein [Methylomonas sp. LW13]|jgi:hypothetical protein|uniref:hypothetical protein n=1 Tax=Methylomonas sp. LW13 TaxID=107637 RepID=UPI0004BCAF60|nr:hypothetical protein [Methylomonas sp. LW13]